MYYDDKNDDKDSDEKTMNMALEELEPRQIESYQLALYSFEEMKALAGDIIIDKFKPTVVKNGNKLVATNMGTDAKRMTEPGGINDMRMGTMSLTDSCVTCGGVNCPAHWGLIIFGENNEIMNPLFVRKVIALLNCVCHDCSRPLFADELEKPDYQSSKLAQILKKSPDVRLALLEKYCNEIKKCPVKYDSKLNIKPCHAHVKLKYTDVNADGIIQYSAAKNKADKKTKKVTGTKEEEEKSIKTFYINRIINILKNISDADAALFGYIGDTKPVDLIMQGILVMPPASRAPSTNKKGELIQNPITEMYIEILKAINNKQGAPGKIYRAVKNLLIKNETKTNAGQTPKSISENMQGKDGIYRSFILGKRGDFCGRTVAGPGHSLALNQISIPDYWSKILTDQIKVTSFNIDFLEEELRNGEVIYVIGVDGFQKPASEFKSLEIGDAVELSMKPGDIGAIGRQPSLSKNSMMAGEVIFNPHKTINSNIGITRPFNLDYDGDELNFWKPRSFIAKAEYKHVMNINNCIIDTEGGNPIIGLVMNSKTSAHAISKPGVEIEEGVYNDMLAVLENKEGLVGLEDRARKFGIEPYVIKDGKKYYKGNIAFSALLPVDFNYNFKGVVIYEGILIRGLLNEEHLRYMDYKGIIKSAHVSGPRSIVNDLAIFYSNKRAADFLSDAPHLLSIWYATVGYTLGIRDCSNMVTDSKCEVYNKKFNKRARLFESELGQMKNIVFKEKLFVNIVFIFDSVVPILNRTIEGGIDIEFNRALDEQATVLSEIVESYDPKSTKCKNFATIKNKLMGLYKDFAKEKNEFKRDVNKMYKDVVKIFDKYEKVTDREYVILKRMSNSIENSFLLTGELKSMDNLIEKKIVDNKEISKMDANIIKEFIDRVVKSGKNIDSYFKTLLNDVEDEYVDVIQGFIDNVSKIINERKDNFDENVKNFINNMNKKEFEKDFVVIKKFIVSWSTVNNEDINTLASIDNVNRGYVNVVKEFIGKVLKEIKNMKHCSVSGNDAKMMEGVIMGIFNEELLLLYSMMFVNLKNELGKEYNKNILLKNEKLSQIHLDMEGIGTKKGLDPEEAAHHERLVMEKIDVAKVIGAQIAKEVKDNAIINLTEEGSGTKGNVMNVGQIMGSVGQQYVGGKRLWSNYDRLSSHFSVNDESVEARGLIESSFYEGLSPTELFFLQGASRDNIIDTAMLIPLVGKLQRLLARSLENVVIAGDGSLRNTNGFMYATCYNCGFNIARTIRVPTLEYPTMNNFIDLAKVIDDENKKLGWYTANELAITGVKGHKKSLEDRFAMMLKKYKNKGTIVIKDPVYQKERKLSNYEKARIIGVRAEMLNNNDPVRLSKEEMGEAVDALKIAEKEYELGYLAQEPALVIQRTLPGKKEVINVYPTLDMI